MGEFLARGATLVLVSHSPESVLELCQRVVWLQEGRVVADGPAADVVRAFVEHATPGSPRPPPRASRGTAVALTTAA